MYWLVSLAQFIDRMHTWFVGYFSSLAEGRSFFVSAALVSAPYALELALFGWFGWTFYLGIKAQRDYFKPKSAPPPAPIDYVVLPSGEELWRAHDFWKRPIPGKWVGPPPPPKKDEPAQVELPVEMTPEPKTEKQKPRIVLGNGKEV